MKKITLEEANNRILINHSGKIKIINYVSMREQVEFECNICGHRWKTIGGETINGHSGCKKCASLLVAEMQKKDINTIKSLLSSKGCQLVSDIYENSYTPIEIRFVCGHIGKQTIGNFVRNTSGSCFDCNMDEGHRKKVRPIPDVVKEFAEKGFEVVEFPNGYSGFYSYVIYKCKYGHLSKRTIATFRTNSTCKECQRMQNAINKRGNGNGRWKGGISSLRVFLNTHIREWKKLSMKAYGYKCAISGSKFNHIHHLYSFGLIIEEALKLLNLGQKNQISEYTSEELFAIVAKVQELHRKYPLGVPLKTKIHELFHSIYGRENFTPEDFTDFQQRIASGEIMLPK